MVPNDAMQASKAEKLTIILTSYDAYEPQKQPAWRDNPGYSNGVHTLMLTSSLVDLKRETVWYWKPSQILKANKALYLGREPPTSTLLNHYTSNNHL